MVLGGEKTSQKDERGMYWLCTLAKTVNVFFLSAPGVM